MNLIKLTSSIHEDEYNRRVLVSSWDVSSVCPRKDGGSTIVTKRGFTYKVDETVDEIEDLIRDSFRKTGESRWNEDRSTED